MTTKDTRKAVREFTGRTPRALRPAWQRLLLTWLGI